MSQVTGTKVELDLEFGMTPDGLLRMTVHGIEPNELEAVITHLGLEARAITEKLTRELADSIKARIGHLTNDTEGEIND